MIWTHRKIEELKAIPVSRNVQQATDYVHLEMYFYVFAHWMCCDNVQGGIFILNVITNFPTFGVVDFNFSLFVVSGKSQTDTQCQ